MTNIIDSDCPTGKHEDQADVLFQSKVKKYNGPLKSIHDFHQKQQQQVFVLGVLGEGVVEQRTHHLLGDYN